MDIKMIQHLNKTLYSLGVGFVYSYNYLADPPYAKIEVKDNGQGWINESTITLTNKYINWLENWFYDNYSIKIEFDATKTRFWEK